MIGDSPGGPFLASLLRTVYQRTGMAAVAQETGAELNLDVSESRVAFTDGHRIKALEVCSYVTDADVVISLPKLKTHGSMHLTGATKNLYGAIPGLTKLTYHAKFVDPAHFGDMLIDVLDIVHPALSIVDGVVGMDGDGPSAGDPFEIGAVLAGDDALAVDLVSAELVGMNPHDVFALRAAAERGRIPAHAVELDLVGDPFDGWSLTGFRVPDAYREPRFLVRAIGNLAKRWVVAVPRANDRCIRCGICVRSCPVDAITLNEERAVMDLDTCIRCYCCHEMCPERAIDLHKPFLARLLSGGRRH